MTTHNRLKERLGRATVALLASVILALAGPGAADALGPSWHAEILDGAGSTWPGHSSNDVGRYNATTVFNGELHVFTYDATTSSLRHDWWDGIRWNFEILDGAGSTWPGHSSGNVGEYNVVAVFNGELHVFTYDATTGSMRHDWWDGIRWHFEAMDGRASAWPGHTADTVGTDNASTVYNGQLHVFTYDATTGSMRHDWWDGIRWHFETLDGTGSTWPGHTTNNVGQSNAVTVYNGQLHVLTYASTSSLRHDWWDGTRWHFETLDGAGSAWPGHTTDNVGEFNSVVAYNTQLQVFTYDVQEIQFQGSPVDIASLRHDWWDGTRWHFETLVAGSLQVAGGFLVSQTSVGDHNVVEIYNGQLQVFSDSRYDFFEIHPFSTTSLGQDWWDGTRWHLGAIDPVGGFPGSSPFASFGNAVTIYNGQLHVFASREGLRHDWWG